MATKKCGECGKSIYHNDPQLALGGSVYHKSCARCATCNGQLSIKNFSTSGNRLLCKTHFKEEFAKGGGVYAGGDKFKKRPSGSSLPLEPVLVASSSGAAEPAAAAATVGGGDGNESNTDTNRVSPVPPPAASSQNDVLDAGLPVDDTPAAMERNESEYFEEQVLDESKQESYVEEEHIEEEHVVVYEEVVEEVVIVDDEEEEGSTPHASIMTDQPIPTSEIRPPNEYTQQEYEDGYNLEVNFEVQHEADAVSEVTGIPEHGSGEQPPTPLEVRLRNQRVVLQQRLSELEDNAEQRLTQLEDITERRLTLLEGSTERRLSQLEGQNRSIISPNNNQAAAAEQGNSNTEDRLTKLEGIETEKRLTQLEGITEQRLTQLENLYLAGMGGNFSHATTPNLSLDGSSQVSGLETDGFSATTTTTPTRHPLSNTSSPARATPGRDYTALVRDHQASLELRLNKVKQMNSEACNSPVRSLPQPPPPGSVLVSQDTLQLILQKLNDQDTKLQQILLQQQQPPPMEHEDVISPPSLLSSPEEEEEEEEFKDSEEFRVSSPSDEVAHEVVNTVRVLFDSLQQRFDDFEEQIRYEKDNNPSTTNRSSGINTTTATATTTAPLQAPVEQPTALIAGMDTLKSEIVSEVEEKLQQASSTMTQSFQNTLVTSLNMQAQRISSIDTKLQEISTTTSNNNNSNNQVAQATTTPAGGGLSTQTAMILNNQLSAKIDSLKSELDSREQPAAGGLSTQTAMILNNQLSAKIDSLKSELDSREKPAAGGLSTQTAMILNNQLMAKMDSLKSELLSRDQNHNNNNNEPRVLPGGLSAQTARLLDDQLVAKIESLKPVLLSRDFTGLSAQTAMLRNNQLMAKIESLKPDLLSRDHAGSSAQTAMLSNNQLMARIESLKSEILSLDQEKNDNEPRATPGGLSAQTSKLLNYQLIAKVKSLKPALLNRDFAGLSAQTAMIRNNQVMAEIESLKSELLSRDLAGSSAQTAMLRNNQLMANIESLRSDLLSCDQEKNNNEPRATAGGLSAETAKLLNDQIMAKLESLESELLSFDPKQISSETRVASGGLSAQTAKLLNEQVIAKIESLEPAVISRDFGGLSAQSAMLCNNQIMVEIESLKSEILPRDPAGISAQTAMLRNNQLMARIESIKSELLPDKSNSEPSVLPEGLSSQTAKLLNDQLVAKIESLKPALPSRDFAGFSAETAMIHNNQIMAEVESLKSELLRNPSGLSAQAAMLRNNQLMARIESLRSELLPRNQDENRSEPGGLSAQTIKLLNDQVIAKIESLKSELLAAQDKNNTERSFAAEGLSAPTVKLLNDQLMAKIESLKAELLPHDHDKNHSKPNTALGGLSAQTAKLLNDQLLAKIDGLKSDFLSRDEDKDADCPTAPGFSAETAKLLNEQLMAKIESMLGQFNKRLNDQLMSKIESLISELLPGDHGKRRSESKTATGGLSAKTAKLLNDQLIAKIESLTPALLSRDFAGLSAQSAMLINNHDMAEIESLKSELLSADPAGLSAQAAMLRNNQLMARIESLRSELLPRDQEEKNNNEPRPAAGGLSAQTTKLLNDQVLAKLESLKSELLSREQDKNIIASTAPPGGLSEVTVKHLSDQLMGMIESLKSELLSRDQERNRSDLGVATGGLSAQTTMLLNNQVMAKIESLKTELLSRDQDTINKASTVAPAGLSAETAMLLNNQLMAKIESLKSDILSRNQDNKVTDTPAPGTAETAALLSNMVQQKLQAVEEGLQEKIQASSEAVLNSIENSIVTGFNMQGMRLSSFESKLNKSQEVMEDLKESRQKVLQDITSSNRSIASTTPETEPAWAQQVITLGNAIQENLDTRMDHLQKQIEETSSSNSQTSMLASNMMTAKINSRLDDIENRLIVDESNKENVNATNPPATAQQLMLTSNMLSQRLDKQMETLNTEMGQKLQESSSALSQSLQNTMMASFNMQGMRMSSLETKVQESQNMLQDITSRNDSSKAEDPFSAQTAMLLNNQLASKIEGLRTEMQSLSREKEESVREVASLGSSADGGAAVEQAVQDMGRSLAVTLGMIMQRISTMESLMKEQQENRSIETKESDGAALDQSSQQVQESVEDMGRRLSVTFGMDIDNLNDAIEKAKQKLQEAITNAVNLQNQRHSELQTELQNLQSKLAQPCSSQTATILNNQVCTKIESLQNELVSILAKDGGDVPAPASSQTVMLLANQIMARVDSVKAELTEKMEEVPKQGTPDASAIQSTFADIANLQSQQLSALSSEMKHLKESFTTQDESLKSSVEIAFTLNSIGQKLSAIEDDLKNKGDNPEVVVRSRGLIQNTVDEAENLQPEQLSALQADIKELNEKLSQSDSASVEGKIQGMESSIAFALNSISQRISAIEGLMKNNATASDHYVRAQDSNRSTAAAEDGLQLQHILALQADITELKETLSQSDSSSIESKIQGMESSIAFALNSISQRIMVVEGLTKNQGVASDSVSMARAQEAVEIVLSENLQPQQLSALLVEMKDLKQRLEMAPSDSASIEGKIQSMEASVAFALNSITQRIEGMTKSNQATSESLVMDRGGTQNAGTATENLLQSELRDLKERLSDIAPSVESKIRNIEASIAFTLNLISQRMSSMEDLLKTSTPPAIDTPSLDRPTPPSSIMSKAIPVDISTSTSASSSSASFDKILTSLKNLDTKFSQLATARTLPTSSSSSSSSLATATGVHEHLNDLQKKWETSLNLFASRLYKQIVQSQNNITSSQKKQIQEIASRIIKSVNASQASIMKNDKAYASALRQTMLRLHKETRTHLSLANARSSDRNLITMPQRSSSPSNSSDSAAANTSPAVSTQQTLESLKQLIISSRDDLHKNQKHLMLEYRKQLVEQIELTQQTILTKLTSNAVSESALEESQSEMEHRLSTRLEQVQGQATATILDRIDQQPHYTCPPPYHPGGVAAGADDRTALTSIASLGGDTAGSNRDGLAVAAVAVEQVEAILTAAMEKLELAIESNCEHIQAQAVAVILEKVEGIQGTLSNKLQSSQGVVLEKIVTTQGLLIEKTDTDRGALSTQMDLTNKALSTQMDLTNKQVERTNLRLEEMESRIEKHHEDVRKEIKKQQQQSQPRRQQQRQQQQQQPYVPAAAMKPQHIPPATRQLRTPLQTLGGGIQHGDHHVHTTVLSSPRKSQRNQTPTPRAGELKFGEGAPSSSDHGPNLHGSGIKQQQQQQQQHQRQLQQQQRQLQQQQRQLQQLYQNSGVDHHAQAAPGGDNQQGEGVVMRRFMDMEARSLELEQAYESIRFERPSESGGGGERPIVNLSPMMMDVSADTSATPSYRHPVNC